MTKRTNDRNVPGRLGQVLAAALPDTAAASAPSVRAHNAHANSKHAPHHAVNHDKDAESAPHGAHDGTIQLAQAEVPDRAPDNANRRDDAAAAGGPAGASDTGAASAGDATSAGAPAAAGEPDDHGAHHGGSMLPYLLGGVAAIGGGIALAAGKGKSSDSASAPATNTTPPATPTLALAADTGASATDGITKNGTINVSGLVTGNKWEYSVNNGATWQAGTGTSFTLAEGAYAANVVQARQTDSTGTVSSAGKLQNGLTIDLSIAAPTIAIVAGDDVVRPSEAAGGVTVSGTAEAGSTVALAWTANAKTASASVAADANGKWSYTFASAVVPDTNVAQSTTITATATDIAGNVSSTTSRTVTTDPGVTVNGVVNAGAVVAGNDLTIALYGGDGTKLASGVKLAADGTFSVSHVELAKGAVVVAVVSNGGASADYLDEATGAAKSLATSLLAATSIVGSVNTIAINPLTTVAAAAAGITASGATGISGTATADAIAGWKSAVAQALGLGKIDVTAVAPALANAGSYDPVAGLSSQQAVGAVLAAMSGMDSLNNGNMQASIASLTAGLSATGKLSDAAMLQLMNGAVAARSAFGASLPQMISDVLAKAVVTPHASIDTVAGDDLITAQEAPTLVVSGTVDAGASAVTLSLPGHDVQATITGTTWSYALSSEEAAALGADGALLLKISATLADSSTVTATRAVSLHLTLPAAPTVNAVATDDRINAAEKAGGVTLTGAADPATLVTVSWGSAQHAVRPNSSGQWSVTFASGEIPADGTTLITASAADVLGNASATSRSVLIDTVPPAAPTIDTVAGNDFVGAAKAAAGVVISGTAIAGAAVAVTWGSTTRSVTADGSGKWSTTFAAADLPADGTTTITAVQSDAAGNSGASASHTVLVAAHITALSLLPVAGNDVVNLAEANQGVVLTGAAPAGSRVSVTWGGTTRAAIADGDGQWTVTFSLGDMPADGQSQIVVGGVDANANVLPQLTRSVIIDTVAPAGLTVAAVTTDDVVNAAEKAAGFDVTGNAEAAAKVVLTWGSVTKTVVADANGHWTAHFQASEVPADGSSSVSATQTDAAGNSGPAVTHAVVVATALPAAPTAQLATDSGSSTSDGISKSGVINVGGLVSGGTWSYSVDNGATWVAGTGSTFSLADGVYAAGTIKVRQADVAGNPSATSAIGAALVIKSSVPTVQIDTVTDDDYVNASEKAAGVTITGSADYDANVATTVSVTWGSVTKSTAVASDGSWSVKFAAADIPADGLSRISAVASDLAGNVTNPVTQHGVTVLTSTPGALQVSLVTDTGTSASDGITNNGTIAVTGVASGSSWEFSNDGGASWQAASGSNTIVPDGVYAAGKILVRQVDRAGNAGPSTAIQSPLTIVTATQDPTIDTVGTANVVNATQVGAGVTVTGTAAALGSVDVTWGTKTLTVKADASGIWSAHFSSAQIPADGQTSITAAATDLAGNKSTIISHDVLIDTVAPSAPTIATVANDNSVNAAEKAAGVTVQGTGTAGTTVTVLWGTVSKTATVDQSGTWSVSYASQDVPADAASTTVSAKVTNSHGNSSVATNHQVGIDTTTSTPVIGPVYGTDIVNALLKQAGAVVGGTAEAGAVVTVNWGTATRSVIASQSGTWSVLFEGAELPADGTTAVTAQAIDIHGNVSSIATHNVTIDSAVPSAPSINAVSSGNIITAAQLAAGVAITGSAEALAQVNVTLGGTTKTVQANASGTWTASFATADVTGTGDMAVTAVARDAAGNVSASAARTVTVPGASPSLPVIAPVAVDNIVNAAEKAAGVRVNGVAGAGATVSVAWGNVTKTVLANTAGSWTVSFAASEIPDGSTTLSATENSQTSTRSILVDSVIPNAPTISTVAGDDLVSASEKQAGVQIAGTAEANATVLLTWGTVTKTVTADAQGNWTSTFVQTQVPTDGQATVSAVAVDSAGNMSAATSHAVTIDTKIVGTAGNDVLTGIGGAFDFIQGLGGDDVIIIPDLSFAHIDGGAGSNTLQLASGGQTLDLTHLAAGKLTNIQTIDITGLGLNSLVVDQASILADTGGTNKLIVNGNATETVVALGFVAAGVQSIGAQSYNVYTSGTATLWVEQTMRHVVI